MEKENLRKDINDKYKWDLSLIYKNEEEWDKDLNDLKQMLPEYLKFKNKLTKSSQDLLEYLEFDGNFSRKLYKVYYYANLHFDEDTTNTKYQEMLGKVENLFTELNEITAFVAPQLIKTPYSKIKKYIKEEQKLKKYSQDLDDFYRMQKHVLTEEQEKILSAFSSVTSASSDIFEALTDADMEFGMILDENNKEVMMNESNYSIFIRSKNRRVREDAFKLLYKVYSSHKNTLAKTFSTELEYLTQKAKIKGYNSSLEAATFSDNISKDVYNNVIDSVNDNLDVAYKYFALKKELLGLKELHMYDIYVDLIDNFDKDYSFEEAKELVFKALEPLGEDYLNHLKRAFDEHWIDIYHNKGKRGGAYSSGFYDIAPYVLLNYEGKPSDVSTLAHELGHSMHSLYSWENNPYETSEYKIFVAEVASTVNELFLNKYLLKNSKDDKEKLYILNELMELFKGTIIRQTMFAEFERDMHAAKEQGEILTHEYLSDKYYKLNQKYFGNNVILDEEIKYEWMRIPHFYYNFYVYKYAIGLSCACYIVNNILNDKENAKENYLKFLKSGGSMYPADELLLAGVDVTSPEVIKSALKMFDETIDEFKKIYENIKKTK